MTICTNPIQTFSFRNKNEYHQSRMIVETYKKLCVSRILKRGNITACLQSHFSPLFAFTLSKYTEILPHLNFEHQCSSV